MKKSDIQALHLTNWPLPDAYLIELGRLSALWASLEGFLNICIGKLCGFNDLNDPKAFILINHASFPQRLDIMGTLCEQLVHDFPSLQSYKDVLSSLKAAQRLRNKYLHNAISLNEQTGKVEMAVGSARGTLKLAVEAIDIADIRAATLAIDAAFNALYKLVLQKEIPSAAERFSA